ncbi:MAG TPA: TIGR02594 family protein, partial [Longimicrobium sp.]|nr:TIGR02594 family protein [Longimicrobium sp.]
MANTLTITADSLNIRSGAGTGNAVVGTLSKGAQVQQLESSPAGDWFRIQAANGTTGWISAKFTAPAAGSAPATPASPSAPTTPVAPTSKQVRVTATSLNLRAEPSASGALVAELPNGIVLNELGRSGDGQWVRVQSPGGHGGWVSAKFVAGHDGSNPDPDAPQPGDPKWYAIAWGERGVKEIVGKGGSNPRIEAYQRCTDYKANDDDVPWCSSFTNWVMTQAGIKGTNKANASSWLTWGKKIDKPVRGCIAVFTRSGGSG